jgi:hypothetical protein
MRIAWILSICAISCSSLLHTAGAVGQDKAYASQNIELPYAKSQIANKLFPADDRLKVVMPDHSVELAQPVDIPVTFTEADVVSLTIAQHNGRDSFDNKSAGIAIGSGDAKIIRDDGLTKTVEIIPLQTGVVNVEVVALFTDGGMSHKSFQLIVVASSKGLKKFYINSGSHALPIVIEDKDEDRQWWLEPEVYYNQLDYPVYLSDSSQIKFTVEQSKNDPVIRLDSNGMIHGLRPGKAKIIASFDGVVDTVVVTVYTKESAPPGYRRVQ